MLRAFLGKLWPIRVPPDKGECVSALLTLLCLSHQLQETLHSHVSDLPLAQPLAQQSQPGAVWGVETLALEATADAVVVQVRDEECSGGEAFGWEAKWSLPAPQCHNCLCTCIILSTLQLSGPALIWKHLPEHLFSSSIDTLPKEG